VFAFCLGGFPEVLSDLAHHAWEEELAFVFLHHLLPCPMSWESFDLWWCFPEVQIIHSYPGLFFGNRSIVSIILWTLSMLLGSSWVYFESNWRSFTQSSTLFLMYCSINDSDPITDPRRRSPWSVILIPTSLKSFDVDCVILLSFIHTLRAGLRYIRTSISA